MRSSCAVPLGLFWVYPQCSTALSPLPLEHALSEAVIRAHPIYFLPLALALKLLGVSQELPPRTHLSE